MYVFKEFVCLFDLFAIKIGLKWQSKQNYVYSVPWQIYQKDYGRNKHTIKAFWLNQLTWTKYGVLWKSLYIENKSSIKVLRLKDVNRNAMLLSFEISELLITLTCLLGR